MLQRILLWIPSCLFFFSAANAQDVLIHELNGALTDIMIPDGFSPPQASRVYYYTNVAYYEVLRQKDDSYLSLSGQLNGYSGISNASETVDIGAAAVMTFAQIGAHLVYRSDQFKETVNVLIEKNGLDGSNAETLEYVETVVSELKRWIKEDGYGKLKSMPRYQLLRTANSWEPTPPAYHDALEPNWHRLRTAVLKNEELTAVELNVDFDTVPGSDFYNEALFVYETVNNLDDQRRETAKFWDCNPMQTETSGHFMFKLKQMTPGGHWMAITGILCEGQNKDELESSSIYTQVAATLYDGFISAWAVKYKYNLIRPVTYINRYIDRNWMPYLETPPFPEYTSAHSVISRASAQVLADRVGENITYLDTVETRWGYPVREFNSVITAGIEVSDSRVYGGIHYRFGVQDGMNQGEKIGNIIVERLKFKN